MNSYECLSFITFVFELNMCHNLIYHNFLCLLLVTHLDNINFLEDTLFNFWHQPNSTICKVVVFLITLDIDIPFTKHVQLTRQAR